MAEKRDYYEVLGVSRDAEAGELKKAYRQLALRYHPDRTENDPAAAEKFKEAAEAYQVLSDPQKRQLYNQFGHQATRQGGFHPGFHDVEDIFSAFGDIFGDFFGFGGGQGGFGGGGRRRSRGGDVETEVELSFEEAVRGCSKKVGLSRHIACTDCKGTGAEGGKQTDCDACGGQGQVGHRRGLFVISTTCPRCRGMGRTAEKRCPKCSGNGLVPTKDSLEVTIPAGVDNGQTLRLGGQGQASPDGGPAGNLYVVLRVEDDERFKRQGADLFVDVPVSFAMAALGGEVTIPTLDGEEKLIVDPGTQPEKHIVLKGRGIPHLDGYGHGDQVLTIKVEIPTELTDRQKEILGEFDREAGKFEKKSFFRRRKTTRTS